MVETPTINIKVALEGIEDETKRLKDEFGKGFVTVLKEVQAELKRTGKDFDSLVPESVINRLKNAGILARDIPQAFEGLKKVVADTAAIEKHVAEVERAATAWHRLAEIGRSASKALATFGVTVGGLALAFNRATASAAELITKMDQLAARTGVSITMIDAMRRSFIAAGGTGETFFQVIEKLQAEADKFNVDAVKRLADEYIRLKKAGQEDIAGLRSLSALAQGVGPLADAAKKALAEIEKLNAVGGRLKNTFTIPTQVFKTPIDMFVEFAKRIADAKTEAERLKILLEVIPTATQADANALAEIGRTGAAGIKVAAGALAEMKRQVDDAIKANNALTAAQTELNLAIGRFTGLGPSWAAVFATDRINEFVIRLDESTAGLARLGIAYENLRAGLGTGPDVNAFEAAMLRIGFAAETAFTNVSKAIADMKAGLAQGWDASAIMQIFQSISSWLDTLIAKWQQYWNSQTRGTGAGGTGTTDPSIGSIPGAARGGFVRGPGTSTSDSILARLSSGEFVMSARAVKHFGAGFFAALNALRAPGFAAGGLVDAMMPQVEIPKFARGGLVGGGSQVSVDLRLRDDLSVRVMAQRSAVDELVRYATVTGQRRAGRPPGWAS